jgi:hypothetical protein
MIDEVDIPTEIFLYNLGTDTAENTVSKFHLSLRSYLLPRKLVYRAVTTQRTMQTCHSILCTFTYLAHTQRERISRKRLFIVIFLIGLPVLLHGTAYFIHVRKKKKLLCSVFFLLQTFPENNRSHPA